jgi:guanosine-3',5'-bis(diphosphate) 3'-pyrophosphohydrolase
MTLAFDAMVFARHVHKDQKRKYTGNPYADHLAEVAGIVSTVVHTFAEPMALPIAVAWLHDCMEDQGVTYANLVANFGADIATGVQWLTDTPLEAGNRAYRKAIDRQRLAKAPGWVQSVKCADLISNTGSILLHDPGFAYSTYFPEKRLLLEVLGKAHPKLHRMASELVLKS